MRAIDLHVHSTYSDGTMTPAELLALAEEKGLAAFALTDHDATKGLDEILALSASSPVEVVPGIEITTAVPQGNGYKDIHILGYYINYHREELQDFLSDLIFKREDRNRKMCERLHDAGLSITYENLRASVTPETILTRAHFARFLLDHKDVSSMKEAFSRYLNDRCPTFVPREKVLPEEAVRVIRAVGGVPVLAHPILYGFSESRLENLIASLKEAGLAGIETVYSTYLPADERLIRTLAKKYNLLMTGGSDFHGSNKPDIKLGNGRGTLFIPEEFLTGIKKEYLKGYGKPDDTLNNSSAAVSPTDSYAACTAPRGLLSFDMDGTLLDDSKKIMPATGKALDEAIGRGYIFTISTGRPLTSILRLVSGLDLEKYNPLISAFNGGCIYNLTKQEILYKEVLKADIATGIRILAKEAGLHFHTYTEREVICERDTEEVRYYSNYVKMEYRVCEDVLKEDPTPYKFIIMHLTDRSVLEDMKEVILSKYADDVQCIFSNNMFLEIIPKTSGKDVALRKMCEMLDVPFERSYAFADQDNDISMLSAAAYGVALVNGSKGAKKAAGYITFSDNNHDGLVPFLNALD